MAVTDGQNHSNWGSSELNPVTRRHPFLQGEARTQGSTC